MAIRRILVEYNVTDNEGRSVSVNADNWLFAAASAFQALGVDLDRLSRLDCIQDSDDGTMNIDMPSLARSWVVKRAERLEPKSDLPWETPTVLAKPIAVEEEPPSPAPEPLPFAPPPPQGIQGVVPTEPKKVVPNTEPAPIDTALGAVATPPPVQRRHREPQPTMIPPDDLDDSPFPAPERVDTPPPAAPAPPPVAPAPPPPPVAAPPPPPEAAPPPPPVASPPPPVASPPPPVASPPPPVASPPPPVAEPPVPPAPVAKAPTPPAPPTPRPAPAPAAPKVAAAPKLKIVASSRSRKLEDEEPVLEPLPEKLDLSIAPPSLHMPVSSTLEREPQESLAERLFDLSMDMVTAEPGEACDMALELVTEFVPCEAASVVRGTLNDDELTFVSVSGPVADKIRGRRIPFGEGIVGMCFDMRQTLIVNDVNENVAHMKSLDAETGFSTLAALCVPILDDEGLVYGVIELLNPTDRPFLDEDEEAVETIARTLAGALAFR